MASYRLYSLDGVRKVASAEWFEAEDDRAAIEVAKKKLRGRGYELWQGARVISRFPPG